MVKKIIIKSYKKIYLYGSLHSDDKYQINDIKKEIENFQPEVLMVEGNFNKFNFLNEKEAISKGKELGYAVYLCKKNNIKCISNDPDYNQNYIYIKNKYGSDVSLLYFFLRELSLIQNREEPIIKNILLKIYTIFDLKESISIEKIKNLYKKIFNEELEMSKNYHDYFNPTKKINLFNNITRELNNYRDNYMFTKIREILRVYNKIFVIKGDYHIKSNLNKLSLILYDI